MVEQRGSSLPVLLPRRQVLRLLGAGSGLAALSPAQALAALAQQRAPAAQTRAEARAAATGTEDWPEVGGKGRLSVWRETGILDKFPDSGLNVLWRTL